MSSIFHKNDGTHRAILWIDNRFQIEIRRFTPEHGESTLVLKVFPITNGEIWDHPYEVFTIDEADILSLENQE